MAPIFTLFVPAIKDYIDIVNNIYDSTVNNINLLQLLQQSFVYFFASIKFVIIYFLSFQWIQDLSYLPVVVPQIKLEIVKEHFFLQNPQSNFFTFLEIPSYSNNKFFLGFLNSFFLCLPLSVAHIISLRRLLIQGLFAGIVSSLGTICGQILLVICILLGGRFFVIPWFNFQVVTYLLGFWLVLKTVYDMCHERSIRIIEKNNFPILGRIFLLNFLLAWTEQSCIFQYFGNLTLSAEPSLIEIFSSLSVLQSILTHGTYISGLILGSLIFTSFFIFITLKVSNICIKFFSILYSKWIRRVNFSLIVMIIAFTFTSIPFYSFDYLVLSNFGFVAQDKVFQNTLFSPTKTYDLTPAILGDGNLLTNYARQRPGIDTDITPFNKGRYLMFDVNDSFEQLNYQGEYAWLTKKNRTPTISRYPSSSAVLSKISKFFKKTKKPNNESLFISDQKNEKTSQNFSKSHDIITKNNLKLTPDIDNLQNSDFISNEKNSRNDVDYKAQGFFSETENSINVLDSRNQNDRLISDSFEKLINTSTSSKFFITNPLSKSILEKKFQQRYYSNPVYKLLLSADIDFFLSRQPKSIVLSPNEEHKLFKKRMILANYYDSLRYYNQLPYEDEFKDIFQGSKSYADRIYNHQFSGTLKIVRRLFSLNDYLTDENTENIEEKREKKTQPLSTKNLPILKKKNEDKFILKFDQALYKKINKKHDQNFAGESNSFDKLFFHEEFNLNRKSNLNKDFKKVPGSNPVTSQAEVVKNISSSGNKSLKAEQSNLTNWENLKYSSFSGNSLTPFIELTNPTPFYVGWDEQLRKLVLTNRLSPKRLSGDSMKFLPKKSNTKYFGLTKLIKKNKTITFTTWPLLSNKSALKKNNLYVPETIGLKDNADLISYNFLVDSLEDSTNMKTYNNLVEKTLLEDDFDLKINLNDKNIPINAYGELLSIPANVLLKAGQPIESQMKDIIPYARGGFVWPGHPYLKISFKNLISNNLQTNS